MDKIKFQKALLIARRLAFEKIVFNKKGMRWGEEDETYSSSAINFNPF